MEPLQEPSSITDSDLLMAALGGDADADAGDVDDGLSIDSEGNPVPREEEKKEPKLPWGQVFVYGDKNRHLFEGYTDQLADDEASISFSVSYLNGVYGTPLHDTFVRAYEDDYVRSIGKTYNLDLFPPTEAYKPNYAHLARVVMAVRIRRLSLEEEIDTSDDDYKKFEDLIALCEQKQQYHLTRLRMLEGELDFIAAEDPSKPAAPFNGFLLQRPGWAVITTLLTRDYKKLQQAAWNNRKKTAEELAQEPVPEEEKRVHMSVEDCARAWDLLQQWRLIRSVESFCRLGAGRYPQKSKALTKLLTKSKAKQPQLHEQQHEDDEEEEEEAPEEEATTAAKSISVKDSKKTDVTASAKTPGGFSSFMNIMTNLVTSAKEEEAPEEVLVLKTLEPLIPGERIGEWGAVCAQLGAKDGNGYTLKACAEAVLAHVKEHPLLAPLVPRIVVAEIAAGVLEIHEEEESSAFVALGVNKVADAIASALRDVVIEDLRHFVQWSQLLEKLRKDRIKHSGGKLTMADSGEVEMVNGVQKIIPHADTIVDTDILHGVRQRVNIHAVIPEARKRLDAIKNKRLELRGELVCLVQYGIMNSVPFLQRVSRGLLQRRRTYHMKRDLVLYSMHAATATIQLWLRAIICARKYKHSQADAVDTLRTLILIKLQAFVRGLPKQGKWNRYMKAKRERSRWFGLTKVQAAIRRFNARCRFIKMILKGREADRLNREQWAIMMIQKWARGYIARKTIVKSMQIRDSISPDLLRLAEKYLNRGDLWSFLKQIDDNFSRLRKEISEAEEREDSMAETFIGKVLNERQSQFDGAWQRFSESSTLSRSRSGTAHTQGSSMDQLTATASVDKTKLLPAGDGLAQPSLSASTLGGKKNIATGGKRKGKAAKGVAGEPSLSTPSFDHSIPGPTLRRAVSSTVQAGVLHEMEQAKRSKKQSLKLAEDIQSAYGPHTKIKPKKKFKTMLPYEPKVMDIYADDDGENKVVKGKKGKTAKGGGGDNVSTSNTSAANSRISTANASQASAGGSRRSKEATGKPQAAHTNWLAAAGSPDSRSGSPSRSASPSPGRRGKAALTLSTGTGNLEANRFKLTQNFSHIGESLLVDVPLGMDDEISTLMKAAAIRSFVPDFCDDMSAEESYAFYMSLPPGLAKMRYETEAWKWTNGPVNALRVMGYHRIRDALPMSKFVMYLRNVGTPRELMNKCVDYLYLLIRADNVLKGRPDEETMGSALDLAEGRVEVGQARKALAAVRPVRVPTPPKTPPSQEELAFLAEAELMKGDATLPGKLLLKMVENGNWVNFGANVDELITHACFLICPYAEEFVSKTGVVTTEQTEMGHFAFKRFTAFVQGVAGMQQRKEAVRRRYRAALIMATPFCLSMRANGVSLVQDLVKVNLVDYGMPPKMQEQVEALVSMAVSANTNAKVVPVVRDHVASNKETFVVPMAYDPKFQRSPFDPYGRPQRLAPMKELARQTRIARSVAQKANKAKGGSVPLPAADLWSKGEEGEEETKGSPSELFKFEVRRERGSEEPSQADDAPPAVLDSEGNPVDTGPRTLVARTPDGDDDGGAAQRKGGAGATMFLTSRQRRRQEEKRIAESRRVLYSRDFEATVRSGFERPYVCNFPGCGQQFSRAYTMKVHKKSHYLFAKYHEFKNQPQLFLDDDVAAFRRENELRSELVWSLPPLVQMELDLLQSRANTPKSRGMSRGSLGSRGLDEGSASGGFGSRGGTPQHSIAGSPAGRQQQSLHSSLSRGSLSTREGGARGGSRGASRGVTFALHVDTNLTSGNTSRGSSPTRAHTPFTPVGGFDSGNEQGSGALMKSFSKFFTNSYDSDFDFDFDGEASRGSSRGPPSPAPRKGALKGGSSSPSPRGPQVTFGASADDLFDDPLG